MFNRDLSTRPIDALIKEHLFSIYQTKEMKSFLEWYKDNRSKYGIKFKGCDDSYWVFYEVLSENLANISDKNLDLLMKNLSKNIKKGEKASFKKAAIFNTAVYNTIIAIEDYLESTNKLNDIIKETLFNGKNTYINFVNIKNNKIQSRDEIMADRISYLAKNKDNKIIVWAHNAHISNKILVDNEIGIMGRDLKEEFGTDYHSIGLMTLKGNFSYIDEKFINGDHLYAEKLEKSTIEASEFPLWEKKLALNGNAFYLNLLALKKELQTDDIIGSSKFIGYGKESSKDIYTITLLKYFDSLLFIENTNATTPLFN
ncbi:erythromycin esterase family protein [Flavobacterium ardleyense]|uniref:Erythromycin esterase family protein n=1 Tax=Flavobacterium ardleyense TaxID=2038737 RepID=A0ABW5Z883_9FLAO